MIRAKYTYGQFFTVSPFLISYHGAVDVGDTTLQLRNDDLGVENDGVRVCYITADAGNDGLGARDIMLDVGDDRVRVQNVTMNV